MGLPVVGLVENMSGYVCPHCGDITNIFGKGGGEEFCRLETEKADEEERRNNTSEIHANGSTNGQSSTPSSERTTSRLTFLGRVPVDPDFVKVVDGPESGKGLLERYNKTKSSAILSEICSKLVQAIGEREEAAVRPAEEIEQATESITLA